jgi:hypothetical protein
MRVLLLLLPLALGGCLAKTALDVATMPVKAVGWTADRPRPPQAVRVRGQGAPARGKAAAAGGAGLIIVIPNLFRDEARHLFNA